ncbi:hypothetical protein DFH06DRAFT_1149727 [Mycena polygramma]|nr:hypothetical protein DFH06DRAFT_1149727 [Mycena polygramma]
MSRPKILHSATYWQEFHRNRAERRARQEERALRGVGGGHDYGYALPGAQPSQPPIITFIPNRAAPLYTFVTNKGSLASSSDSLSIRPLPTTEHEGDGDAPVPELAARREAAPAPSEIGTQTHRRASVAIAARAQARLRAKPSDDEALVQRLQKRRIAQPKQAVHARGASTPVGETGSTAKTREEYRDELQRLRGF